MMSPPFKPACSAGLSARTPVMRTPRWRTVGLPVSHSAASGVEFRDDVRGRFASYLSQLVEGDLFQSAKAAAEKG